MLSAEAARRPRPTTDDLRQHVLAMMPASGAAGLELRRDVNDYASHYASEILTLESPGRAPLRLLIKYDDGEDTMADGLLTVGPGYESRIYQQVLPRFNVTVPRCYGTWHDPGGGSMGLVIAHLDGVHAHHATDRVEGMARAAAWAGRFHALTEPAVGDPALPALNTYDARLYTYWAHRALQFERRTKAGQSWLHDLMTRLDDVIALLRGGRQTIIHGDFYPDNMMYLEGVISVFDWEQTAVAPGEIDLASLTHLWDTAVVEAAEDAYRKARWPDGVPTSHYQMLDAARVFLLFRLLGEARGWPNRSVRNIRVELLRQAVTRLGFL